MVMTYRAGKHLSMKTQGSLSTATKQRPSGQIVLHLSFQLCSCSVRDYHWILGAFTVTIQHVSWHEQYWRSRSCTADKGPCGQSFPCLNWLSPATSLFRPCTKTLYHLVMFEDILIIKWVIRDTVCLLIVYTGDHRGIAGMSRFLSCPPYVVMSHVVEWNMKWQDLGAFQAVHSMLAAFNWLGTDSTSVAISASVALPAFIHLYVIRENM